MQCFKPIYIDNVGTVPCGKCVGCRIARTREWALRLLHESCYFDKTCFLTLTYDDEHLPRTGGLVKSHLQLFFKLMRLDYDIKYFACGEYGDLFGRPHYHVILFGINRDSECFYDDDDGKSRCVYWHNGFINVGNVSVDSINYVTGYVQKKYSGKLAKEMYGDKLVPFCVMSKGLGKRYLIDNVGYAINHVSMRYKGKDVGLPRYYKKIIDGNYDINIINDRTLEKAAKSDEWFAEHGVDDLERSDYQRRRAEQRYEELKSRVERRGKIIK